MISFEGGVSFHRVVLVDLDSGNDTIDIIAERLKTPSTSFYKPMRDAEEEFVRVLLQNNQESGIQIEVFEIINTNTWIKRVF